MRSNFNNIDYTYNSVFFETCCSLFSTHPSNQDSRIMGLKKRIMNAMICFETYFFLISSWKWPIVLPFFCRPKLFMESSSLVNILILLILHLVNKFEMKRGTKNGFSPLYARTFCSFLQEHAHFRPFFLVFIIFKKSWALRPALIMPT